MPNPYYSLPTGKLRLRRPGRVQHRDTPWLEALEALPELYAKRGQNINRGT